MKSKGESIEKLTRKELVQRESLWNAEDNMVTM